MAPGACYLTAAVLTGVTVAAAPARAEASATQMPIGPPPSSLQQAHATLDSLRCAVKVSKEDLVELKTRATQLGVEISRAQASDSVRANRLERERSSVLDELSSLRAVLPAVQGQRHALAHAVHDAEQTYRDTQPPPKAVSSLPLPEACPEVCNDHP